MRCREKTDNEDQIQFMLKKIITYYMEGIPSRKNLMPEASGPIQYLRILFMDMPVGLVRLMQLQPLFALVTSLLCIFMLKRGFEYVPVVIVSLIFAFFYITFRLYLMKNSKKILSRFWDAALLFLLNNMLLFVLPFYIESMTVPSRNMLFAPIIIGLTVISGWFSLYQRWIMKHSLRSSLFYALTFFCVLNFLFPVLFGMRNIWSLLISGSISSLAVVLFVYPHIYLLKNKKNTLIFLLSTGLLFALLWFGRSIIPPSPLKLTHSAACLEIADFRAQYPFTTINTDVAHEVYFYTSIFAPRGLSERINHVWYHNSRKLFTVSLKEIHGGRKEGFGTWSRHIIREGPGIYCIEVWTAGGQLLGTGEFVLN